MTPKKKLDIIKEAAAEASKLMYDARCILQDAEDETGYDFGYQIMQELQDGLMGGLRSELEDICCGGKDKDILQDLEAE